MRKITVAIHCDTCHLPFAHDPNISGSDPAHWQSVALTLEWAAQLSGWHCFHDRHECFDCIMEALHPEEFMLP